MTTPITTAKTLPLSELLFALRLDISNAKSAIRMQPEVLKAPEGMEDLYFPEIEPVLEHSIEHLTAAEKRIVDFIANNNKGVTL